MVPVFNKIGTHVGFSFFEDNLVGDSLEVYIRGDELFGNALNGAALNFSNVFVVGLTLFGDVGEVLAKLSSAYAGCRR